MREVLINSLINTTKIDSKNENIKFSHKTRDEQGSSTLGGQGVFWSNFSDFS